VKFLAIAILALSSLTSAASPNCTTEAKDKWKDPKAFQQSLVDQGYKIKVFKETKTSCYEIYGWDKEGKKVEIYFNPVTGDKVKEILN
jgi:hypothetical protein